MESDSMDSLIAHIRARSFPCLGAKAAVGSKQVDSFIDGDLRTNTPQLAAALRTFVARKYRVSDFAVLAAIDPIFQPKSEESFEEYLWDILQKLYRLDVNDWDPLYSKDPADTSFKFSFAGAAFYVVGLSPTASRMARRFEFPTVIFNPVWQFERLREKDQLESLIDRIRARDLRLQGSINPNLRHEGILSDAIQYSGREVEDGWNCPFQP